MAYYENNQPLFDCWSDEGSDNKPCRPRGVGCPQSCCYGNLPDMDNRPMFDCWSDEEAGRPCMPWRARKPQLHLNDNVSDSSLHSCNSAAALKQWTTATTCCRPVCRPPAPCCMAARRRSKRRSKSAGEDEKDRSELLDECDINNINCNRCTYIQIHLH